MQKIIDVAAYDEFYTLRSELIGRTGDFYMIRTRWEDGFLSGRFVFSEEWNGCKIFSFRGVKIEECESEKILTVNTPFQELPGHKDWRIPVVEHISGYLEELLKNVDYQAFGYTKGLDIAKQARAELDQLYRKVARLDALEIVLDEAVVLLENALPLVDAMIGIGSVARTVSPDITTFLAKEKELREQGFIV
jgi:hypothetical protein